MTNREHFGSRAAVIMAMAGSAIGLGNIWRFPFIVGEYGGAAFILIYILCCFFLSLPILLSESIIGRRTHQNTFGAMSTLAPGTKWKWLGLLTIVTPIIILSYYSVVGGWSFAYLLKACSLQFNPDNAEAVTGMFAAFSSSAWGPLACLMVFLGLTALIIFSGVKKGIEKFSKISMPVLFVLIVVIAVYSVTLPGAMDGVRYLVKPDFSKLSAGAFSAALGQSFFSLSLGVGTMLIYSSYIRKDENILASGTGTALFDMLFAILAGFAVMPAVFAAGIAPSSGPGKRNFQRKGNGWYLLCRPVPRNSLLPFFRTYLRGKVPRQHVLQFLRQALLQLSDDPWSAHVQYFRRMEDGQGIGA